MLKKWGFNQVLPKETRTDDKCEYTLEKEGPRVRILRRFGGKPIVGDILAWLGRRPVLVKSRVDVRHGRAWLREFSLWIWETGVDGQGLIVGFAGTPGSDSVKESNWERPAQTLAGSVRHPDYAIGTHVMVFNADTGGGPRASEIWVELSPYSTPDTVSQLMQFNLRCITRVRSCRDGDLMPTVLTQLKEDENTVPANPDCTADLVKHVAHLADVIGVVRVESAELTRPSYVNGTISLEGYSTDWACERSGTCRLRICKRNRS
jgi:hypothetical protein